MAITHNIEVTILPDSLTEAGTGVLPDGTRVRLGPHMRNRYFMRVGYTLKGELHRDLDNEHPDLIRVHGILPPETKPKKDAPSRKEVYPSTSSERAAKAARNRIAQRAAEELAREEAAYYWMMTNLRDARNSAAASARQLDQMMREVMEAKKGRRPNGFKYTSLRSHIE